MIFLNVYPTHTQAKLRFDAVCQTRFEIFFLHFSRLNSRLSSSTLADWKFKVSNYWGPV